MMNYSVNKITNYFLLLAFMFFLGCSSKPSPEKVSALVYCNATAASGITMKKYEVCANKLLNLKSSDKNLKSFAMDGGLTHVIGIDTPYKISLMRKLITSGANINFGSNDEFTPLQVATIYSDVEAMQILLSYNPDLTIKNEKGLTALDMAKNINTKRPTEQSQQVLNLLLNAQSKQEKPNEIQSSLKP